MRTGLDRDISVACAVELVGSLLMWLLLRQRAAETGRRGWAALCESTSVEPVDDDTTSTYHGHSVSNCKYIQNGHSCNVWSVLEVMTSRQLPRSCPVINTGTKNVPLEPTQKGMESLGVWQQQQQQQRRRQQANEDEGRAAHAGVRISATLALPVDSTPPPSHIHANTKWIVGGSDR
jgi:hypothetical protein